MKNYFISFEYWNNDIHKWSWGIEIIDLEKTKLIDLAKIIIMKSDPEIKTDNLIIRITAFNNIS